MNRPVYYIVSILLAFGMASLSAQQSTGERISGTPFYNVEISRYPTGNTDSSKVVLYLKLPYDALQFVRMDSIFRARYEVSVVAFDMDDIQVDSEIKQGAIDVKTFEETNSRELNDYSRYEFLMDNDQYKFTIGLMDLDTRKTSYRKIDVNLRKTFQGKVQLSDLIIVDQVADSTEEVLKFDPNVVDKLNDRQKEYYVYYTALGDSGVGVVTGEIVTTDGEVLRTQRDSIPLSPTPSGHFIRMDSKDLDYSRYVYRLRIEKGDTEVSRTKEFRVGWIGMSDHISNLDRAIEQMIYVMSGREINKLKDADSEEKKRLFMEFWKEKDPTPETANNELMNEYFRRVSIASEEFSTSIREGWRTDRGMVFILFGSPNDIERHPFELGSKPYQIWYYFEINRQFVFVDESGFGDYRLITPLQDYSRSTFY